MEIFNISRQQNQVVTKFDKNLTVTCMIKIHSDITKNYKILEKNKFGELLIVLTKNKKLIFYYGNGQKYIQQIESSILELDKLYHITYVRSVSTLNNYIYVNGILDSHSTITQNTIYKSLCKINMYSGDKNTYSIKHLKIYDTCFNLRKIQIKYLYDISDFTQLIKHIYNNFGEVLEFSYGLYDCLLTEDIFIMFMKHQTYTYQKDYPKDIYIKYNAETIEQNVLQLANISVIDIYDLGDKFDMLHFVKIICSWQYGMCQNIYPKVISNVVGFWSYSNVSPFYLFMGKGLKYVDELGQIAENTGTFQCGNIVAFTQLIISQYVRTSDEYLKMSLDKLIDYIINIYEVYHNGGVPAYFPKIDECMWKYNISMRNGNYVNFLRTVEVLIQNYDSPKNNLLVEIYNKSFNLLLDLQIRINDKKTIWAQYYDKKTLAPIGGDLNEPIGLCTMESAQILLYLMSLEIQTPRTISAIENACNWFVQHAIHNIIQTHDKHIYNCNEYEQTIIHDIKCSDEHIVPLHSRFYDICTQLPIFKEYDESMQIFTLDTFNNMNSLSRCGYIWLGMWSKYLLGIYDEWKKINCLK